MTTIWQRIRGGTLARAHLHRARRARHRLPRGKPRRRGARAGRAPPRRLRRLHRLRRPDARHDRRHRDGSRSTTSPRRRRRSCCTRSAAGRAPDPAGRRRRARRRAGRGGAAAAAAALARRGRGRRRLLVLAGGSTPRRAYELAAERHSDWGGAELWYGDDRCVPPTRRALQPAPRAGVAARQGARAAHRPRDPDAAGAGGGGGRLRRRAARADPRPRPARARAGRAHGVAVPERSVARRAGAARARGRARPRAVRRADHADDPGARVGGHVVFLAVGEGKADAVRRAFAEEPSPSTPASLVRSRTGVTTAILDDAAAALLP